MKKLYSLLGAMLVGASLFAQTNYTCTFSANVPMDSVQVKNTVSGEAKMLYYPDNVITLQKVEKQDVAIATVANSAFLQQTANNIVAVNVETASLLNLTLYSANGTVVARYANAVSAGQYTFQVGASAGVYVLVASANDQTASLKLSLLENAQAGIFEVATAEPVAFLKSADDVITFNEGETFEFTGYYKKQTDVKTSAITENTTIEFEFEIEKPEIIENGAIKAVFSVSETKKVYFSQGNLQYQASTEKWRFAENQFDKIGKENKNISQTYDGWIDLFGWGTSGWNSGAKAYQPYSIYSIDSYYYPGGANNNNLTGDYANADWGIYNAISNGGNESGMWRTLTNDEWMYIVSGRIDAASKLGPATVNDVVGLVLLPDNWVLPNEITFYSGFANAAGYRTNKYSASEWAIMEQNGAVFLPACGYRYITDEPKDTVYGYYWSSIAIDEKFAYSFRLSCCGIGISDTRMHRYEGCSVRLVQDVE